MPIEDLNKKTRIQEDKLVQCSGRTDRTWAMNIVNSLLPMYFLFSLLRSYTSPHIHLPTLAQQIEAEFTER
jgi:hypothetical protein